MKKSIVFVEDDKTFSGLVRELRKTVDALFLGDAELIVLQGMEMLTHVLATGHIILIIMDLTLPDSPPSETIEWIKRESQRRTIVVLTGDERLEVRRECIFAGAAWVAMKKHVVESPNFFFADLYNAYLIGLDKNGS